MDNGWMGRWIDGWLAGWVMTHQDVIGTCTPRAEPFSSRLPLGLTLSCLQCSSSHWWTRTAGPWSASSW